MSADTSTIIIVLTIIGTATAFAVVIMPGLRDLRRELHALGERVARLESAVDGLLRMNIGERLASIEAHLGLNGRRYEPGQVQTREEK